MSGDDFALATDMCQSSKGIMMAEIRKTLQELIDEGNELLPRGGDRTSGFREALQPEYLAWRIQSLLILRQVGDPMKEAVQELESDENSRYFYSSSVGSILGCLKGALALVEPGSSINHEHVGKRTLGVSKTVFVVHGTDARTKSLVSSFLKSMDLVPVILHEQSNKGLTVIEKFEQHADVEFAVVLLTPDDVGRIQSGEGVLEPRARQNVIFELGYFIGRLGRDRVCAITKGSVEIPSDYSGVLYIPLDDEGEWMTTLKRELKSLPGAGKDE